MVGTPSGVGKTHIRSIDVNIRQCPRICCLEEGDGFGFVQAPSVVGERRSVNVGSASDAAYLCRRPRDIYIKERHMALTDGGKRRRLERLPREPKEIKERRAMVNTIVQGEKVDDSA